MTRSPRETAALGERLAAGLRRGVFVSLCGGLGTGKTVFAAGVARGLGVTDSVTSPTFQLVREYEGRLTMSHLDFYRLSSAAEADYLDIGTCLERGIVVAEWGDRFPQFHGAEFIELEFAWVAEKQRRIRLTGCGGAAAAGLDGL